MCIMVWHEAKLPPYSDRAAKSRDGSDPGGVMLVGMNIDPERLAFDRLQVGLQPERQFWRAVAADQQMCAAFRFKPIRSAPARRLEAQCTERTSPGDGADDGDRVGETLRRPPDQWSVGRRHFGWNRER